MPQPFVAMPVDNRVELWMFLVSWVLYAGRMVNKKRCEKLLQWETIFYMGAITCAANDICSFHHGGLDVPKFILVSVGSLGELGGLEIAVNKLRIWYGPTHPNKPKQTKILVFPKRQPTTIPSSATDLLRLHHLLQNMGSGSAADRR